MKKILKIEQTLKNYIRKMDDSKTFENNVTTHMFVLQSTSSIKNALIDIALQRS
jgi:hypothetical protein